MQYSLVELRGITNLESSKRLLSTVVNNPSAFKSLVCQVTSTIAEWFISIHSITMLMNEYKRVTIACNAGVLTLSQANNKTYENIAKGHIIYYITVY